MTLEQATTAPGSEREATLLFRVGAGLIVAFGRTVEELDERTHEYYLGKPGARRMPDAEADLAAAMTWPLMQIEGPVIGVRRLLADLGTADAVDAEELLDLGAYDDAIDAAENLLADCKWLRDNSKHLDVTLRDIGAHVATLRRALDEIHVSLVAEVA